MPRKIAFVTTPHTDPWAGSEELWARTALDLADKGFQVFASASDLPLHKRMVELRDRGVELWLRPRWYSLHQHPIRRLLSTGVGPTTYEVKRLIDSRKPSLVVFSEGNALPPIDLLELCVARDLPFVTITQANKEAVWYSDGLAARYRAALAKARRCYFVADGNRWLSEKQIGGSYVNAEVVHNPVNIDQNICLPWPDLGPRNELRFACVGRLYPPAKGQDILLEALSAAQWKQRSWKLYIYGDGEMGESIRWLAQSLGIAERVVFAGFATVSDIWAQNHVLVMPSRFEGLPLAMIEAMLCGRPVIATDIAGHREVLEDGVTGYLAEAPSTNALGVALERFWNRRDEAEELGKAGARKIRKLVGSDPIRAFSDKLLALVDWEGR